MRVLRDRWRKIDKKTLLKNLLLAAVGGFLLVAVLSVGLYAWYAKDLPDPNTLLTRDVELSTKIYDRTGEHLLYEIAGDEKRTLVTLDDIPDYLEHAVIAAEDRNFYEHHGVAFKGILRAVIFGGSRGGGSTITQQLVKNAILSNEQTLTRKAKEIILSLALERNFSKEEILQMYFNEIPYGSTNYGIESASRSYFSKNVSDLTLGEAATLAGLPQLPTTYLNNPDLLKARRDWILDSMAEFGYITQSEADVAKTEDNTITVDVDNIDAPHFVLWVKEQLVERYGERAVEQDGLKVITTLDYDKQKIAEEDLQQRVAELGPTHGFNNAGLVAMDPKTGEILAMVGSKDYFDDTIQGQVNVALRPLQPGSSFKPIVYAAAFEKGYTPNTLLWDVHTTFQTETGTYTPYNYNVSMENGPITLRKALQGSLNIPAVKLLYLVGVQRALDFAERIGGYTTFEDRSNFGLAIVLGGAEVKLLEHTAAYATFADNGKYHEPVSILNVEDAEGTVLDTWKAEEHPGEQVVDSNITAMMSNVLSDNASRTYVFGNNPYLTMGSRPVALKTGTTNENKDAWTMGYTPSLVTGVWVGNTDGTKMKASADGSRVAAPIWHDFMSAALEGTSIEAFPSASIPTTGKDVLDGKLPTTTITIDTASGKLATALTPEQYRKEVTCGEFHEILHYVDKDDPRGNVPSNPGRDPYYDDWEASLDTFITKHNASLEDGETAYEECEVPTEEDDVHTERNKPEVSIREPDNGENVGRSFAVKYNLEMRRDFSRVEFFIDGTYFDSSRDRDESTVTLPSWVETGDHTLTVTAYDDVDNEGSDEIRINVTESGSGSGSIRITNPFDDQTIDKTAASYTISLESSDAGSIDRIILTSKNILTGDTNTIATVSSPSAITSATWSLPDEGRYAIYATAYYLDGQTAEAQPIVVYVNEWDSVPLVEIN